MLKKWLSYFSALNMLGCNTIIHVTVNRMTITCDNNINTISSVIWVVVTEYLVILPLYNITVSFWAIVMPNNKKFKL
jgi:hypothetical protein